MTDRCSQPCSLVVRLEERMDNAEGRLGEQAGWLRRVDGELQAFKLGATSDLVALKTKMLMVSALGAIVGSLLGTILAAVVIYKLTGR